MAPQRIFVRELTREFLQAEARDAATVDKAAMALWAAQTGVREVEITGFVSAKAPWGQAAAEVVRLVSQRPGVIFRALYLMPYGLTGSDRGKGVLDFPVLTPEAVVHLAATPEFNKRNYGHKSTDDALASVDAWCQVFDKHLNAQEIPIRLMLSTVWGSAAEAAPDVQQVVELCGAVDSCVRRFCDRTSSTRLRLSEISLADTDGRAGAAELSRAIQLVREALPDIEVSLHLHSPSREHGMEMVLAGLEQGVTRFDSTLGGFGGCPNAAGIANINTLDLAKLMDGMPGYDTGINLEKCEQAEAFARDMADSARTRSRRIKATAKASECK